MDEINTASSGWQNNFMGLSPEEAAWESAKVVVLPVPYDLTTSYLPGARRGPQAIIEASHQVELYDDELADKPCKAGICTLPPLEVLASGPEAMAEQIEKRVLSLLVSGKFPIVVGGDHSITHGILNALSQHTQSFSVLQLDAHADLRANYHGSAYSHACVGRRVCEAALPLVQLGVRSYSGEEAEFMRANPGALTQVSAHRWKTDANSIESALATMSDPVYITLDLDVFDPSIMPSTGTPEPGGMDWYAVLAVLRRVFETRRVIGCDVVELAPLPALVAPDFLAARLIYKIIGYWHKFSIQFNAGGR